MKATIDTMNMIGGAATDASRADAAMDQYFTFFLKETLYGIEIGSVREIIEYEKVNAVPCVPDYIKGVINVRGEIIPVIDLSQRLFSRSVEITRFTAIAVIEVPDRNDTALAGIIVDRVNRVMEIGRGTIAEPEVGYKIRHDLLRGIGSDGDRFIMLLNERQMLNIDEMSEAIAGAMIIPAGEMDMSMRYTRNNDTGGYHG
jgi:purine-binding chemotaxis protein CheW